jgi:hypothetical protein
LKAPNIIQQGLERPKVNLQKLCLVTLPMAS